MNTCELFLGRMQPIHNGHAGIIASMKNPVVAIVKGAKSSQDKTKNPLNLKYQQKLLKKVAPNAKVIEVPSGYLPDICKYIEEHLKMKVSVVHAGTDRLGKYKAQVMGANKKLPSEEQLHVSFKEAERAEGATSATVVREAIRSGDEKAYRAHVPRTIWDEFNTLQKMLTEEIDMSGEFEIKPFSQWLQEEVVKASAEAADGDKESDKINKPAEMCADRGASGSGDTAARKEHANQLENGDKTADGHKKPVSDAAAVERDLKSGYKG